MVHSSMVSGALHILSWTGTETTMLIVAVLLRALWTALLPFATKLDKEVDQGGPLAASLRRAHALRRDKLKRQQEISNNVQKLCRSGTLISKQANLSIADMVTHGGIHEYHFGQWRSDGVLLTGTPTRSVNSTLQTLAIQLLQKSHDDFVFMQQRRTDDDLLAMQCVINAAYCKSSTSPARQGLMQRSSISFHGYRTTHNLVCEVLYVHHQQCVASMNVKIDLPMKNLFSSWKPPCTVNATKKLMISNKRSIVDGSTHLGFLEATNVVCDIETPSQSSQGLVMTDLETDETDSNRLLSSSSDDLYLPECYSPGTAECLSFDTSSCPTPHCSFDPIFIRHPDGSLMWAAPLGYKEATPPCTPTLQAPTGTSQMRETARALRNAVEREITADKLRLAAVRKDLLRKLLLAQVLVNLASGVVCICCGTPELAPSDWELSVSFLLVFWWASSILHCFIGFLSIRSAREHVFSMLSALALASAVGQMWLACALMNAVYPEGPPASIVGAISVLWDLPLRLAVGSQAWLLQIDLRYLLLVRREMFISIDNL